MPRGRKEGGLASSLYSPDKKGIPLEGKVKGHSVRCRHGSKAPNKERKKKQRTTVPVRRIWIVARGYVFEGRGKKRGQARGPVRS